MRDHELELIAALVEGRLDDETEARALIASSSEAREEYEAQNLAYESLQAMGGAQLSEIERSTLRRDVWTELRANVPTGRSKNPWYYHWVPVAAGLFVVVGLAAVLTQVAGGGDEAALTSGEISTALDDAEGASQATTTTAAAAGEVGDGDDALEESAPATTEAMTETTAADMSSARAASFYQAEAARVREGDYSERLQLYQADSEDGVEGCLAQLDLPEHRPVATLDPPAEVAGNVGPDLLIAAPDEVPLAEAPLTFVDLETCDVVYRDVAPR
jgi:hypothetical protein